MWMRLVMSLRPDLRDCDLISAGSRETRWTANSPMYSQRYPGTQVALACTSSVPGGRSSGAGDLVKNASPL